MKKVIGDPTPETRNIRKITRASKNKNEPSQPAKDIKKSAESKKSIKPKKKFSKPKDKTANIEVRSHCIEPNASLDMSTKIRDRENSSDQVDLAKNKRDHSTGAVSQVVDVSNKLSQIKLNESNDDHKPTPKVSDSQNNDDSISEQDADMDDDEKSQSSSANIEKRRTRRTIKRPQYLASNYQLEDNKDNKNTSKKQVKPAIPRNSITEEHKSAFSSKKSIQKVTRNDEPVLRKESENPPKTPAKEPHVSNKTSRSSNIIIF